MSIFIDCFKFCRKWEKCFLQMFKYEKKSKLWSDGMQNVRRLIRACYFCPSISQVFPDDVTCRIWVPNIFLVSNHWIWMWYSDTRNHLKLSTITINCIMSEQNFCLFMLNFQWCVICYSYLQLQDEKESSFKESR